MSKICDHTSVGMLVWNEGKLLLIERSRYPFGFAPPAGHVDGDSSYDISAKRELEEEVGLVVVDMQLVAEGRKENMCRRLNGTWHHWKVYQVTAEGQVIANRDEAKRYVWVGKDELGKLATRAHSFLKGQISEEGWVMHPGLEPVWLEWFTELKYI